MPTECPSWPDTLDGSACSEAGRLGETHCCLAHSKCFLLQARRNSNASGQTQPTNTRSTARRAVGVLSALQDFKVLYPTLTDYDIRYYIFLLLKALDYRWG